MEKNRLKHIMLEYGSLAILSMLAIGFAYLIVNIP